MTGRISGILLSRFLDFIRKRFIHLVIERKLPIPIIYY